jgi:hypothetical protein
MKRINRLVDSGAINDPSYKLVDILEVEPTTLAAQRPRKSAAQSGASFDILSLSRNCFPLSRRHGIDRATMAKSVISQVATRFIE